MNKTMVIQVPNPGQPAPPGRPGPFSRRAEGTRMMVRPTLNPLMSPMYWACCDLLVLVSQVAEAAATATATDLRRKITDLFAMMNERGQAAGIRPDDLTEASYAIMALFDEILVKVAWPGRQEWQASPLQFIHFRENTAGDNFFRRAEALAEQPQRAHVLEIYFLCMGFGFQGRYAMGNPAEGEAFYKRMAGVLASSSLPAEVLSPHGVPPDAGRTLLQREAPIVRLGLALFAAAILLFIVLRVVRSVELSRALDPMRSYGSSSTVVAGKP